MKAKGGKVIQLRPGTTERADPSQQLIAQWFELYRGGLLRYLRRLLPPSEDAEDVLHDVFHRVLRHQDTLKLLNPQAYLMTVARNTALDRLRQIKRRPRLDADLEEALPYREVLEHAEMLVAVERALRELPEKSRRVFALKRFHGMETTAIAQSLGISPRMVQKHLAKVMTHLHDRLT